MKNEIDIVKALLLPLIKDDVSILTKNIDWEAITSGFIFYENDPKLLYTEIYRLDLPEPEKLLSKLTELHRLFIGELAEEYVLGRENTAIKELLKKGNNLFSERVAFLSTLKHVIIKKERERLKLELPHLSDRIDFSLSDTDIESVVKKKARTELKDKFNKWDKELKKEKEDTIFFDLPMSTREYTSNKINEEPEPKPKGKVISLTWIKYAVAAIVIVSAGYFFYDSNEFQGSDPIIADLEENTQNVLVITESGLGYTDSKKKDSISITYIVDKERKKAIEDINNSGIQGNLKNIELSYIFINNRLRIYGVTAIPEDITDIIVKTAKNKYYLKVEELYFPITEGEEKKELKIEADSSIIEQLDKIIFNNE